MRKIQWKSALFSWKPISRNPQFSARKVCLGQRMGGRLMSGLGGDMGVSPGSFAWAGAGKTIFWVDPVEEIVAVSMTQALGAPHCRSNLGNIIYGAISATNITSIHRAKY